MKLAVGKPVDSEYITILPLQPPLKRQQSITISQLPRRHRPQPQPQPKWRPARHPVAHRQRMGR